MDWSILYRPVENFSLFSALSVLGMSCLPFLRHHLHAEKSHSNYSSLKSHGVTPLFCLVLVWFLFWWVDLLFLLTIFQGTAVRFLPPPLNHCESERATQGTWCLLIANSKPWTPPSCCFMAAINTAGSLPSSHGPLTECLLFTPCLNGFTSPWHPCGSCSCVLTASRLVTPRYSFISMVLFCLALLVLPIHHSPSLLLTCTPV